MNNSLRLTVITLLLSVSNLSAATLTVGGGGTYGTIKQAADAAAPGDLILVSDGVYGGFYLGKPVQVKSVNGPQVTVIDGAGAGRCVELTDGASLTGFTLTNGLATSGGGAQGCTLYNCTLTGNSATYGGGGAALSTLYYCTLTRNSALTYGGGAWRCTLYNCRVFSNTAYFDADYSWCDGALGSGIGSFIGFLQQYGLPTDGSADNTDSDHDGMSNWQEWVCGTCPTNPLSALRLLSVTPRGTNATVTWQTVAGVNYSLKRSANLASPFTLVATNITGQAGTTTYKDTNASSAGPFFYRVGVNSP